MLLSQLKLFNTHLLHLLEWVVFLCKKVSLTFLDVLLQENVLPAENFEFMSPRYRPSSLPSLPSLSSCLPQAPDPQTKGGCLSHQFSNPQTGGETRAVKTRSLCGQISSPLVSMTSFYVEI